MYETVIKDTKVKNEEKLSYKEFKKLIEVAKRNRRIAENMYEDSRIKNNALLYKK